MTDILILVVIFISYVGLGIPDSLLGSAWPAMYPDLGVSSAAVSIVSTVISLGTIISSFMSDKIVRRFKTAPVALVSTAMTAVALLGFSFSRSIYFLCLFAIPQGLGAGSIDVALNNYVARHYKASQMNFLHCSYGIGVALSPFLMSMFLRGSSGWAGGYRTMFFFQFAIAVIIALSLPLWKKAADVSRDDEEKGRAVKFSELCKNSAIRVQWLVFFGSCAIESVCLVWGSTYLVKAKSLSPQYGARIIVFYFVGMTLGRFLSGFLVKKISCETVVYFGQGITLAAIIILIFSHSIVLATVGLFMVGLGNGPLFPNMTQLTVKYFDKSISQAVIGSQMGFAYVAILITPLIFSLIAKQFGEWLFPYYLLAFFVVMAVSTIILKIRVESRDTKNV